MHTRPAPSPDGVDADAIKERLWAFVQQSLDYTVILVEADQRV